VTVLPSEGPGAVEFQLYLLRTMKAPEPLLTGALDRLGRTEPEMRSAADAVSRMLRPRLDWARPADMAGDLDTVLSSVRVRSGTSGAEPLYRLPLWEGHLFSVSFLNDRMLQHAKFVRDPGRTRHRGGLRPWEFLEEDLPEDLGEIRSVDGWGHYATYLSRHLENGREYFLRFAWGMLQEIEDVTGPLETGANSGER